MNALTKTVPMSAGTPMRHATKTLKPNFEILLKFSCARFIVIPLSKSLLLN